MIVPSCRRRARLRTCGVGASSPAPRMRRSTRLRLVQMPRRRRRAVIFLWPSPTNGDSAISRRIARAARRRASRRPGPAGGGQELGSEALRRRRCSHAADLDTPATRQTRASGGSSRSATFSASATEGGGPSPRSAPAGCRCPSTARRSCAAPRPGDGPPRARPRLQALPAGRQELLTPRADRPRRLAGLARQRVQTLAAQQLGKASRRLGSHPLFRPLMSTRFRPDT